MKTINPTPSARRVSKPVTRVFVLGGVLALLTGCGTYPESHQVSAPPPAPPTSSAVVANPTPVTVVTAQNAPAPGTIIVTQVPPPQRQEVAIARPEQPSVGHVWVEGYWVWRNSRYEWMAGHWTRPPNSGAVWVAPRWEQEGNSYRFYEGYWRY